MQIWELGGHAQWIVTVHVENELYYCSNLLKQWLVKQTDGYCWYFEYKMRWDAPKWLLFPKRLDLKWEEINLSHVITTANMPPCVNTLYINNLSFSEHITPTWKLIDLRKYPFGSLCCCVFTDRKTSGWPCISPLSNLLKKYKKPLYININIYKTVSSNKEGMEAHFVHLFRLYWNTFWGRFSGSNSRMYRTADADTE